VTYTKLAEKVNLRCEGKKPSPSTLSRHLTDLYGRMVLDRKLNMDRSTHYFLEKEFKEKLDTEK
jgi:hypothetical protein